jgi:hypothetical protein
MSSVSGSCWSSLEQNALDGNRVVEQSCFPLTAPGPMSAGYKNCARLGGFLLTPLLASESKKSVFPTTSAGWDMIAASTLLVCVAVTLHAKYRVMLHHWCKTGYIM